MLLKEIKLNIKSITFWVLIAMILVFYLSQFSGGFKSAQKPLTPDEYRAKYGQEPYYGYVHSDELEDIMKETYSQLMIDYHRESAYLEIIMFNKTIKLSDEQLSVIENAFLKLAPEGVIDNKLSEEEFYSIMDKVDKAIGKGSWYSKEKIKTFYSKRRMTYEEALEDYNLLIKEGMNEPYSRLFADYIGIAIGLFTVFVAATALIKDKKKKTRELIYTTSIPSSKLVIIRYFSIVLPVFLAVLILAVYAAYEVGMVSKTINPLPFIFYSFYWLLPTLLFVVSLAFVLQLIFKNGIIPIIVMFLLWFNSMPFISNQYRLANYVIRYNAVTTSAVYNEVSQQIMYNRIFTLAISIILLVISIVMYEKQRGKVNG